MGDVTRTAVEWLESAEETIERKADSQWRQPELPLQETHACSVLSKWLESEGFDVSRGVSDIETAFLAEYRSGDGNPAVGFIAEYDALPGLSNAVTSDPEPLGEAGPGHGCGHNLIGTGNTAAAIATKEAMMAHDIDGTVRVYGSPGEELLIANVFMARDGLFDDADVMLTSHPHGGPPTASAQSSLALISTEFSFDGQTCHIPSDPAAGRNALDSAVSLINSANQLGKHLDPDATIEYTITQGGSQPNVVPSTARVWFFLRHPDVETVGRVHERIQEAATGAATATGTTCKERLVTGCHPYLLNERLAETMYECARDLGPLSFAEEDRAFAGDILDSYGLDTTDPLRGDPTLETVGRMTGSQDDGDVSWLVPMGRFLFPYPRDLPLHTWGATTVSGSRLGKRSMRFSAAVLACTALDVLTDTELLAAVREEFRSETRPYDPLVPDDVDPVSPAWVRERIGN